MSKKFATARPLTSGAADAVLPGGAMAAAFISMGTASADTGMPDAFVEFVEWVGYRP